MEFERKHPYVAFHASVQVIHDQLYANKDFTWVYIAPSSLLLHNLLTAPDSKHLR